MQRDRIRAKQLSKLLYGGEDEVTKRREIWDFIERDEVLNTRHYFDRARAQMLKDTAAKVRRVAELARASRNPEAKEFASRTARQLCEYDRSFAMRYSVHAIFFREAIRLQGTSEQWETWKHAIDNFQVFGCFAMTELGHSSALTRLETTATLDIETSELVVNSPSLLSTKFFVGGAGHSATHAVVICQLVVRGKQHGLVWLIVALRSLESGQLLPGVLCGECGPKASRLGVDNGWIRFSQVRVPRANLLSRWSSLNVDGDFSPPLHPALPYLTLIGERLLVIEDFVRMVQNAIVIATRFGWLRRQGGGAASSTGQERSIITYEAQYTALVPIIAHTYSYHFAIAQVAREWRSHVGTATVADAAQILRHVPVLHAMLAGLKAWCGWWAADSLEVVRRSMGGHAFSLYSAIPQLTADIHALTSAGGDNTVMMLQHIKFLESINLKSVGVGDNVSDDILLLERLQHALLRNVHKHNAHSAELRACSRLSVSLHMMRSFSIAIAACADNVEVLNAMRRLVGICALERESCFLQEYNLLSGAGAQQLRQEKVTLCMELLSDTLTLTDAFDFPDFVLKAPLGCKDESQAYQRYFDMVRNASDGTGRATYFQSCIAPLTNSKL
jgi:alkylation response protein AidB-like acyl-CoA dehydrogenase